MKRIIRHPFVRRHAPTFMRFAIAGGVGACIDFGVLAIQVEIFDISPHIAYIPSGLGAVVFVFFFNKYVTFKNHEPAGKQGLKFALVYSTAFVLNYVLATGFYSLSQMVLQEEGFLRGKAYLLAKAAAIGIVSIMNYTLSHGFIFKRMEDAPELPV